MTWRSTKTYDHNLGLSCAFRQWRAESHCKYLHGYAMAVSFVFETDELDVRNWAVDFGSLKSLKGRLEDLLDHKTLVAEDDPNLWWFQEAERRGILKLRVLPSVGCERLAEYIFEVTEIWLTDNGYAPRVRLVSVEVREHGANSAVFLRGVNQTERFIEETVSHIIPTDDSNYDNQTPISSHYRGLLARYGTAESPRSVHRYGPPMDNEIEEDGYNGC